MLRRKSAKTAITEETGVRLEAILGTAVDAIITTDHRGTIETFNRAAEEMFGYEAIEVIGRNVSILVPEPHAARHDQYMRDYVNGGQPRVIGRRREINALRRDGTEFPIELALSSADLGGRRIFTGMIRDISRRRAAETELSRYRERLEHMVAERTAKLEKTKAALRDANARLKQMVRVDALTGIGNRRAFDERLAIEFRRQQRNGDPLSVIICDIDYFKSYNDFYGHPAGDACLRRIAGVFSGCFQRATEFAARYGGEEFAAILADTELRAATERAEALRGRVNALGIAHGGRQPARHVTLSVGVASFEPDRTSDRHVLVEAADAALYRAKQNGRNRVEIALPEAYMSARPTAETA